MFDNASNQVMSTQKKIPSEDETSAVLTRPMRTSDGYPFDIFELLFFSYRDFIKDPDLILHDYGFGRAHHRVLYFVNRRPGIMMVELLEILHITKQSLGRVLRQLIETQHISQNKSLEDGRARLLFPTERGRALALMLAKAQSHRIERALSKVGPEGIMTAKKFLYLLIDDADHETLKRLENT